MNIIEAITTLRSEIEKCSTAKSDQGWQHAATAAGLKSNGNKSTMGIDEEYLKSFGPLELRVHHTCRDTSKPFQIGPDRTRVKLEVRHNGAVLDTYSNGYED